MEMLFKGFFNFENKKSIWEKLRSNDIERDYLKLRSEAVNKLNPMYETWNNEFNKLYPGKDGYSDEYTNFICDKQRPILDAVNKKFPKSLVELFSEPETECDIGGMVKKTKNKFHVLLKPLDR